MLTVAERELICTAVDGELSREEATAFQTLLATNSDAECLYHAFCRDRDALARLPKAKVPKQLYASVMARVQPITPKTARTQSPRRATLLPLGMAASFLLAVATGTFWFATNPPSSNQLSKKQLLQLPNTDTVSLPSPERAAHVAPAIDDQRPMELPEFNVEPMSPAVALKPDVLESPMVESPQPPKNLLAAPVGPDAKPFERHIVKLPMLLPIAKLTTPEGLEAFRTQLAPDVGTRLDLFVKDAPKAIEALAQAGKSVNLSIITETIANERLKRRMPSTWMIYTDSLSAEQATKWMQALAEYDAKSPSVSSLHVLPTGPNEQKELLSMLGVDLNSLKKTKPTENGAHISANTLNQVTQAMQKGEPSKPAILLTHLPQLIRVHPALSRDVKLFNELRKDRKTGTTPLMVFVRTQN